MSVKLAVASNLCLPVTSPERLDDLATHMAVFAPAAVVLAGNLAESLSDLTRVLKLFRHRLTCPILVLPGDRDFWARPPYDSRKLFRELLPAAVANHGCRWLEGNWFVVGDVAVVGSVAWYDYSAAPLACNLTELEMAQQKYQHNADALRIDWEWSDGEFAAMVSSALLARLDTLEQDASVRSVVVVTHFPILEGQLARQASSPFAAAYSGNLTLGRKVLLRSKVRHIISGHSPVAKQFEMFRCEMDPVEVRVAGGDYEKPAWVGITVA